MYLIRNIFLLPVDDLCGLIVLSYMLHRSTTRKKGECQGASRAGTVDFFYQCKPVSKLTCANKVSLHLYVVKYNKT